LQFPSGQHQSVHQHQLIGQHQSSTNMMLEASSHKSEIKIETLCELQNNRISNMKHACALDKDIEKIRHLLPKKTIETFWEGHFPLQEKS
jgi:hypothetical protein